MSLPSPSTSPATPAANTTAPPSPAPPETTPPPILTPSAPAPSSPSTPAPAASPPSPTASAPPTPTPSPPSPSVGSASPPTSPPAPSGSSIFFSPPPPSGISFSKSPPPPPTSSAGSSWIPATPSSSSSSGITTSVVVGVAIGSLVILVVLSLFCICCCKKKKRRRNEYDSESYYAPSPPQIHTGPKDDPYGSPAQWRHNIPPPPQQHMMQPTPTLPTPSWKPPSPQQPPTPPPQPFMSSSGGSGSSYPGSEVPLPPPLPPPGMLLGFTKSTFTYEELAMATNGFSEANVLGQGGFGYVHKGILPNGKEIAVKSLKVGSRQGEREFKTEVEIISQVHHKHLVSLVGYCITGAQRMLVYEFVPNNTLEFHLHGRGRPPMEWPTRLRIALGAAKGLSYLHEDCHPKIIHRDIKAANILLDFKFEAKVADFGLAKLSSDVNTHVSTRVMGTFGYLAPEYAASGKLTDKSDVFSFGVMLLELITGRRPVDTANTFKDGSLVDWARPAMARALEEGNFGFLVDSKLQNNYDRNEMAHMIASAAACVRHSARLRPRMSQIVRALEGDVSLSDLSEGIRPGQSNIYGSYGSSDYDSSQYKEDMKRFRRVALTSSEYGGTTSEYGTYQTRTSSVQTTREMEMGKMGKQSRGFA